MAITRWMVASCRMRFFALGDQDTITFMNAHLNHMTAKKEVSEGSHSLKLLWDEIVGDIIKFGVRILTGDWNMQLFSVVTELRARGLQANLAAWYPWKNELESGPRIDSCAVIMIGPCEGIRMNYDCSVLGIEAPERPSMAWHNVEVVKKDDRGRDIKREPYEVSTFPILGSGFPLTSYRPLHTATRKKLVAWTFEGVTEKESPAVVGTMRASARRTRDQTMFPLQVDNDLGSISWTWPSMPPCKQKLIDIKKFDPDLRYFNSGAHMPLMVFVGAPHQVRRSQSASKRRERRAQERGWGAKQRLPPGRGWCDTTRVGGQCAKSGDAWSSWQPWSAGQPMHAWSAWSSDDAWRAGMQR